MAKALILIALVALVVLLSGCVLNGNDETATIGPNPSYSGTTYPTATPTLQPGPVVLRGNLSVNSYDCVQTGTDGDGNILDELTVSGTATGPEGAGLKVSVYSPVGGLGDPAVVTCSSWSMANDGMHDCVRQSGEPGTTAWTITQSNYKNSGTAAKFALYSANVLAVLNIKDESGSLLNLASGHGDVPCPH